MAVSHKGKFITLYLVLLFISSFIHAVLPESIQLASVKDDSSEHKLEISEALDDVLKLQKVQLEKMEGLVQNFTELLARLESHFSKPSETRSVDASKGDKVLEKIEVRTMEQSVSVKDAEGVGAVAAVPVTRFSTFWSERFQFVSAVKLGSNPTCINVLPNRDFEGFSTYIAVGDDLGRVIVLARNGDVLVQFDTLSKSPITAMVSFMSLYKNESIVITGHEDGAILMHRAWEDSSVDDWNSIRMENIVRFDTPEEGPESAVTLLEVHHVGQKKYILSTDLSGKIRVFRDNGVVYGVAVPSSRPLAFLKQRLLFLTEAGAGSLDLRTMKIREAGCEGLNSSTVKFYVFDASEKSKAYGFTSEGNVIHVLLLGDIMNFKCRIRSKKKFDISEPVAFQTIKGYLLIGDENKVFVFNVSSQHYVRAGGPKFLFSAPYDGMVSSFLNQHPSGNNEEKPAVRPVITSNQERLVVFSLRGGYVAMYRSDLPVFKNEFNAMQWTSPVLIFILFLFGAWHFFAQKKEALTSWGPDDPFAAASTGPGSSGNVNDNSDRRAFAHSSRDDSDVVDLGNGPSRRYVPPSQYSGVAVNSFRSGPADANAITTSVVEPNFLKNQEMKFRGSNLESSGFPKRRDSLFGGGGQALDEKN